MSPTRLTTYGVYLLGACMVIAGLVCIVHGIPIVRMELGWTQIMGGSVAASAGCIVLVLGLLLQHVEGLRDTLDRLTLPLPVAPPQAGTRQPVFIGERATLGELRAVHPLAPAAKRERSLSDDEAVRPEPALTAALHPAEPSEDDLPEPAEPMAAEPVLVQSAPALVFAEKEEASHGPVVVGPDPVADPLADAPAVPTRPNFLATFLARRAAWSTPPANMTEPVAPPTADRATPAPVPPRRSSVDLSSGWEEEPIGRERPLASAVSDPLEVQAGALEPEVEPVPVAAPEPPEAFEPVDLDPPVPTRPAVADPSPESRPDPLQPVVVGRYNAGAASYVMYSNGMIEVETEQGTHQFASMQDLKAFIERRDAQVL